MMPPDLLHERALSDPDRIAILADTLSFTWLSLNQRVDKRVKELRSQGIKPNDRVALYSQNSIEYLTLLLSIWRIGGVAVLFSTRFPEERVRELAAAFSCSAIWSGELEELSVKSSPAAPNETGEPSVVVFTSGSTSTPKAALLSYQNLHANALGSNLLIPFQKNDRWLLSLPLYHVGGLGILFRTLSSGGTIAIPKSDAALSDSIRDLHITHLSLVPTQLYRLLQEDSISTLAQQLKAVLVGGAPLSPSLAKQALDTGLPIYASYGLTEMGSQVCTKRITEVFDSTLPYGKPLNGRAIRISESGEILVKGDSLFQGYLQTDSSRVLPLDSEGWFPTGDIGYVDRFGDLHLVGRRDNMFISGGENIHPEEIETALAAIAGIVEVIVVPLPDPEFGHRPVAFLRTEPGSMPDAQMISKQLSDTLPRFKLPIRYFGWPMDAPHSRMKPERKRFEELARELMKQPVS